MVETKLYGDEDKGTCRRVTVETITNAAMLRKNVGTRFFLNFSSKIFIFKGSHTNSPLKFSITVKLSLKIGRKIFVSEDEIYSVPFRIVPGK